MEASPHHVPDATLAKPARAVPPLRPDMRVRAIALGFYPDPGQIRPRQRNPGDVFVLSRMEHFSPVDADHQFGWMEWASTPPTITAEPPLTTLPDKKQAPFSGLQPENQGTGTTTPAPSFVDSMAGPGATTAPSAVKWPTGQGPEAPPAQSKPVTTEDF